MVGFEKWSVEKERMRRIERGEVHAQSAAG